MMHDNLIGGRVLFLNHLISVDSLQCSELCVIFQILASKANIECDIVLLAKHSTDSIISKPVQFTIQLLHPTIIRLVLTFHLLLVCRLWDISTRQMLWKYFNALDRCAALHPILILAISREDTLAKFAKYLHFNGDPGVIDELAVMDMLRDIVQNIMWLILCTISTLILRSRPFKEN